MPDHAETALSVPRTPFAGPADQLGFAVADLEAAIKRWLEVGVGPWFTISGAMIARGRYHDQPSSPRIDAAYSQLGDVRIELVHPVDEEPSVYRDFIAAGGEGVHRLAWFTEDLKHAREEAETGGHHVVQSGLVLGADFAYYELAAPGAVALELGGDFGEKGAAVLQAGATWDGAIAELVDPDHGLVKKVREEAAGWDGQSDPVRHLHGTVAEGGFEVEQLAHRVMRWFEKPLR